MSELVPSILVASSSIAFSLWCRAALRSSRRALQRSFPAMLRWLLRLGRARHHQCQLMLFCTWSRPSPLSLHFLGSVSSGWRFALCTQRSDGGIIGDLMTACITKLSIELLGSSVSASMHLLVDMQLLTSFTLLSS